ncbi:MAG: hypothetical protein A3C90_00310 [Candidatus Magasanikbacteria bacterium RIFCSPHIGHO2_02_FULL_51_14]|uniref:UDP-glucose/GDP-mannose dehydrogenase C-terminal domain-containing protein n=1 Tax=Candidatus Magasanikbacteria bacterium RIFCSPHIGHO2_02_FULL_51_14 TaxID=1798683 RepID=A0A1F6MD54_9BACT|nr:MAG: hypothetical protein A3C90_00310 [Candidatus Magasanikbacteria bacterium RIFCSPHIGHO2_02_FULL_51_14]
MVSFEELKSKQECVCIVGLGYVGLPLAVLLSKHFDVMGFDVNEKRAAALRQGSDATGEVAIGALQSAAIEYSTDPEAIRRAKFIIVAVPTPVDEHNIPDLTLVKKATETVGKHLVQGTIVVYESTVYPGVTEDICLPILEKESGLRGGADFKIGYSPERVNPGDKTHTIDKVTKVVSAMDEESLEVVASVYGAITNVFRARSIKVAEAAKVIENTQRDLNIAFMNELAVLFHKMGFSVYDVLEAARTKWNFLPFEPGLVGGHCIGVDPYYLTYKAQEVGHTPEVILAGRGINDSMHKFIAHQIVKTMVRMGKDVKRSQFVILGITFKENIPDARNSKVAALYKELMDFGVKPVVSDPHADAEELKKEYGIGLVPFEQLPKADTLIVAVAHDEYKKLSPADIKGMMNTENLLLADIKRLYTAGEIELEGIGYWSL